MFPVLTPAEIARIVRFGRQVRFEAGERLYVAGERSPGMFLILQGSVIAVQRDAMGPHDAITRHAAGQFTGEIGQLSGGPALVDGIAEEPVHALLLSPEQLRALIIAEADLGERIVRAWILRRVALLQAGSTGLVLIGSGRSPGLLRLRNFLQRNGVPHHVLDIDQDGEAAAMHAHYGGAPDEALVVGVDGTVLRDPDEAQVARCSGLTDDEAHDELFDVVVVGAGPAGLATAVYAASEGLRVMVLDCRAFGGQAGASARIENYLGFPTGIGGQALTARAFVQAQKFGAHFLIPAKVVELDCRAAEQGEVGLLLSDGRRLRSRTVVIATGARYRRPSVARLEEFEGRGVWYWASSLEARLCAGTPVVVVGGGNSAGQAAVYLAGHASHVYVAVRGPTLAASMSRYLMDRVSSIPNVEVLVDTELCELDGDPVGGLTGVAWRCRRDGRQSHQPVRNVFLFVGAEPEAEWLRGCGVAIDPKGFVLTGDAVERPGREKAAALETSVPGVFAIGDVRSGSVKRVGAAIGEGAAAVSMIHRRLAA
jgi:thioredoxin reductase (NADPH)